MSGLALAAGIAHFKSINTINQELRTKNRFEVRYFLRAVPGFFNSTCSFFSYQRR